MSLYVELYEYVEVYYRVRIILLCSCVDCDRLFLYNTYGAVYRLA